MNSGRSEPLILSQLDFLMRNGVRSHDFRVDAVLPEGWGDRLQLVGRFRRPLLAGKPGRWMDWQGQVFANFARVEIARIFPNFSLGEGVALQRGRGALRIWADISKGEWVGGVADVALVDAAARLGTGLEPLEFLTLTGRIGARAPVGGFEIQTEGLQFQTRDGLLWPGGNLLFSHSAAQGRAPARSELRADRLDLAAVSQIAGRLPLATATHALISGHPVKGLVETVQARWQGETAQPETYELRAKISGLDVRSAHAMDGGAAKTGVTSTVSDWPGVQGATLEVDMNQTGGKGRLVIARGALFFPGAFEDPLIPVETLAADAQWQVKGDSIEVRQLSVRFANSDAQGELSGSWRTSDRAGAARFPGVIDLKGSFSRADGARVHRYLPLGIPADVRHYVRDSVLKGEVNDLLVRIKGDLNDIPFADPRSGEFRFAGKVRNLDYAYVPPGLQPQGQAPWPMLTSLTGELVFDRASMRVIGASARMVQAEGLQLSRIEAQIPDFMNTTTVVVSADIRGPAPSLLTVVNKSPISQMTGDALSHASVNGEATGRFRLQLPLATLERSKVQGTVTLAGNDVRMTPDTPLMAKARGLVTFSDSGFQIIGGQARMLGGDLRLEGGTRAGATGAESVVLLRAQGTVTADGLRQATELGFFSRLARHATGGAAYSGSLGFRGGLPELMLSSNLQGLGSEFAFAVWQGSRYGLAASLREHAGRAACGFRRIPEAGPVAGGARTPGLAGLCARPVGPGTARSARQHRCRTGHRGIRTATRARCCRKHQSGEPEHRFLGGGDVQCGGRFPGEHRFAKRRGCICSGLLSHGHGGEGERADRRWANLPARGGRRGTRRHELARERECGPAQWLRGVPSAFGCG
jgi:uncharacterized protein YhdP